MFFDKILGHNKNESVSDVKPPRLYETDFGDMEYSFEISADFVEFNSHSEVDPSFLYEPDNTDDFTSYKKDTPTISIFPDDEIYDAVENNLRIGDNYKKKNSKYFSFKTTKIYYGDLMYGYAFLKGTARELEVLDLIYSPKLKGTKLEKKLKDELDKVAESYKEKRCLQYIKRREK